MDKEIEYLKKQSLLFEKLQNDEHFLYSQINSLPLEQIEELIEYYREARGPHNVIRLIVLYALKNGEKITKNFVEILKEKFNQKDIMFFTKYVNGNANPLNTIQSYASPKSNNPFKGLKDFYYFYTFFYYGECKNKLLETFEDMASNLIKELNLFDYTFSITGFNGPRNQGQKNAFVNIFPSKLNNYNNAISFFYEITGGNFYSGISKSTQNKAKIEIPKKFLSAEYKNYREANKILNAARDFVIEANEKLYKETGGLQVYMFNNATNLNNLSKIVKNLYWYQAIGLSMYLNGKNKSYKVKELEKQPIIARYSELKDSQNVYLTISAQLQIHTGNDSKFVNYTKKTPPAIFDKNENAEWYLTENGIKYIESELAEDLNELKKIFSIEPEELRKTFAQYSEEDFLNEVFIDKSQYEILRNLLLNKKNLILQGAPGVGKTYAAKRLAYSILGTKDDARVKIVQFHQSYGYEDFILGYRPTKDGFELKHGPFYDFCKEAEKHSDDEKFFFIIDEINRGKLSKIFGELLMLIEPDKRGDKIELLYEAEPFSVPQNVYIIGMMNTADRSIAMIDYALRRRFAFFDFKPAFETESFIRYKEKFNNNKYNALIAEIIKLNKVISEDCSLGSGFQIGHSYFCNNKEINDEWLNSVVDYEIIPLLKEYWFDEQSKIETWANNLKNAIK